MNNEFEKIFLSNFDGAKKAFIKEFKEKNAEDFENEVIAIDVHKGTLYVSSMFQDSPELLIQDRDQNTFLISYSWKEKAYTIVFNKERLLLEEQSKKSLRVEDDKREKIIELENEHLNYLIFSFINYIMIKNKASE